MERENSMQGLFEVYKSEVSGIFQQLQTDSVDIYEKKTMFNSRLGCNQSSIASNMAPENELNEELAEVNRLIEDNESREIQLLDNVKEKLENLRKRTSVANKLITNRFANMAPRNFTDFLSIFLLVLTRLIEKLSEAPNDINKIFKFLATQKAPVNFGLWLEQINSMYRSDKGFYLSYYLLCLENSKAYKILTIGMPKLYITKMLNDLVKNRIKKLMENDSVLEVYSLICQLTHSRILVALDMALACTFVTSEMKGNTVGYTSIFLYIYIKSQSRGNPIIDAAAIVAIFLHEFTHFLSRVYSNSIQSYIDITLPLADIYRIEEYFIEKHKGQALERTELDDIINKRKSGNKKWGDSGFLFERAAFGCEIDFINIESATYLMSSENFDLAHFRNMVVFEHEVGKKENSYVIRRPNNEYNCVISSFNP